MPDMLFPGSVKKRCERLADATHRRFDAKGHLLALRQTTLGNWQFLAASRLFFAITGAIRYRKKIGHEFRLNRKKANRAGQWAK